MTSVILPKRSIIDLIDEELYTVPNSPILNHGSPVYNPLLFQNTSFFLNNLSNSALNSLSNNAQNDTNSDNMAAGTGSEGVNANSSVSGVSAADSLSGSSSPSATASPINAAVKSNTSVPSSPAQKAKSLFTFNSLNNPSNYQNVFNDYTNHQQSYISPNKLLKSSSNSRFEDDDHEDQVSSSPKGFKQSGYSSSAYTTPETEMPEFVAPHTVFNDSNSFNVFKSKKSKSKPKTQTMKIKTLSPPKSDKFTDLVDPNVEPSHSIKFDFNDHDSIFINAANDQSQYHTQYDDDFIDYNYEYELDDLSEYESDNDDDCFDHYGEDSTVDNGQMNEFPSDIYLPESNYKDSKATNFYGVGMDELNVSNLDINDVSMNVDENEYYPSSDALEQAMEEADMEMDMDVDMDLQQVDEIKPQSTNKRDTGVFSPNSKLESTPDTDIDDTKEHTKYSEEKKQKKKYDEITDHHCNLINPNTGTPCDKQFSRPYDLIRHQETIHASKKKIFRCVICEGRSDGGKGNGKSKTFSRGDALSRHIKVKHQLVGQEALDLINSAKENVEFVSVC